MESKLFCFCNTLEHLLKSALFRISLAVGLFSVLNKSVATVALWQCKPVPEQPVDCVSVPWRGSEQGRTHHLTGFTPKSIREAGSPTRVRSTVWCKFPRQLLLFPCLCYPMLCSHAGCTFPARHQNHRPLRTCSASAGSDRSGTRCSQQHHLYCVRQTSARPVPKKKKSLVFSIWRDSCCCQLKSLSAAVGRFVLPELCLPSRKSRPCPGTSTPTQSFAPLCPEPGGQLSPGLHPRRSVQVGKNVSRAGQGSRLKGSTCRSASPRPRSCLSSSWEIAE